MIPARKWLAVFICFASIVVASNMAFAQESQEGRLMRFPDIYKDKVAFVYGGDIWLASTSGGVARRITAYAGRELFPKFSPDGKWIAFTGQYDGNFNVYVMPSDGGQPRQLTFHQGSAQPLSDRMGIHNEVATWTPDSKRIVFLTRRDASNGWIKRPYTVSVDGGLPEPLPMDQGGLVSYSADGTKIAYNMIFRNFRQWKRYTGGLAQAITVYDFKNNTSFDLPHTEYTDTFPMWHGSTIYFSSDRGGPEHHFNLYSYDVGSKQVEQVTHFTDWDVMWPSLGSDAIIFENAGYLYTLDFQSKQPKKLSISLPADRPQTLKHWDSAGRLVTDFDIAPDGKRAVFAARGDVFTAPAKEGSIRNLTRTPGIREQKVSWSPDGRWIAYVSDRTGEAEIYIAPQDGLGKEQQITSGHKGFMFPPAWSPDSKKIAWADQKLNLWYTDISDKKPVKVDQAKYGEITNYNWSPDSKWLAYDKQGENQYAVVYLYSLADGKSTGATSSMNNSYNAVFDPEGKYLYYFSDRDFNEVLGNVDFEFANPKTTRVYVVTLKKDEASPFGVQSDETEVKKPEPAPTPVAQDAADDAKAKGKSGKNSESDKDADKDKDKDKKDKDKEKEKPVEVKIDLDGIQDRVTALATAPEVMRTLAAGKGYVYYLTTPIQGLSGPLSGESSAIHAYDMKDRKEKTLIENVGNFALSFDGSKLIYSGEGGGPRAANNYGIIDAKPAGEPKKAGDGAISLNGMKAEIDPPQEWKNVFNEVWRQERDYFYEASMNGVDWQKEHDKYAQLLPYVSDRYSLTYIMADMIGDLSNSHTYVGGGDYPDLHPVNVGLLGVDFDLDQASGTYRIKKIYPGENWNAELRSPLTEPGIKVKEGDYLLAVNGRPLRAPQNPYELFVNTANDVVTLTVNSKASEEGSHTIQVKPINDEANLRQLNMINTNRKKVDEATGGKVGYVYLPDMGEEGLNEFVKQYFPQIRKQGIIFDVRYNGGGFVDELIFARLRRIISSMDAARNWESGTRPANTFFGSMVCLTNHYAASDGDIFSYAFKKYGLGPLIGERTWGGVRGIRGQIPLMDGGYITRPEFSLYGMDSKWIIENRGVQPDIVVENRPEQVVSGKDPQLEKAIEVVMKSIQENPKKLPARPPDLPAYPLGPG